MDKAEYIKCQHGFTGSDASGKKDKIDLSELLEEKDFVTPRSQIGKVIDYRVAELFEMISAEIKKIPRNYLLPAGVVLAGGGANLAGLPELTKNRLRLAVRVGRDYMLEGLSGQLSDPAFAVAAGLVIWGFEKEFSGDKLSLSNRLRYSNTISRVGKWFKNFMP